MISLVNKGRSVDKVEELLGCDANAGQLGRLRELGHRTSRPSNYIEAEGAISHLELKRMLGPSRLAYLVRNTARSR
jgi:hypothetical protein